MHQHCEIHSVETNEILVWIRTNVLVDRANATRMPLRPDPFITSVKNVLAQNPKILFDSTALSQRLNTARKYFFAPTHGSLEAWFVARRILHGVQSYRNLQSGRIG